MMIEQSIGRYERRATSVVITVLVVQTLWAFLHKYLPLDAPLWSLQFDLIAQHMRGHSSDGWQVVGVPSANILLPYLGSLLAHVFSGEVVVRLLLCFVAILLRGLGYVVMLRVLRVRDEAIYYLIPVFIWSGLWFSGAIPYLAAETLFIWVAAFLLAQERPRGNAYWILSAGLTLVALLHSLVFIAAILLILFTAIEQRRTLHLSQGWLSTPRTVMSLLLPGAVLLLLGLFTNSHLFSISTSQFVPGSPISQLGFFLTATPDILEASFRGAEILRGAVSFAALLLVLGLFGRAFLLAIEEMTWQSRALKSAAILLILLSLFARFIPGVQFDSPALMGMAIILYLGAAYSRGPAIRRNAADRLLVFSSTLLMIVASLVNGFSINRGSEAATEAITNARRLLVGEANLLTTQRGIDSAYFEYVVDSELVASSYVNIVGSFSYAVSAPLYLYQSKALMKRPSAFQPLGGAVRQLNPFVRSSPAIPLRFPSPTNYLDSNLHILAALPIGTTSSDAFGPTAYQMSDTTGTIFDWGKSRFQFLIGRLQPGSPRGLASRISDHDDF